MTLLAHDRAELAKALDALDGPIGLVATMGALHDGHRALIARARAVSQSVVVTVFVNPLQFGANEDLGRYPRTLEADVAMCAAEGADLVWAPAIEDVYPDGPAQVRVDPGPLGAILEGSSRPAHFAGMLTVVAKLLNLVRPAVAFFGEKDYQQLVLVTRMVADLELGVAIAGVPTVRESDGLALSSRNVYLSPDERVQALSLSRALVAGRAAAGTAQDVLAAAWQELCAAGVEPDYLDLRGADLGAAPQHGAARLLVAARIGTTRLIDNTAIEL
ncbi:MAG TPA: pantoate--beta-alanine ligase [Jatrophihabitans sp.]|jgi:pantoate--beta-alanine ligase